MLIDYPREKILDFSLTAGIHLKLVNLTKVVFVFIGDSSIAIETKVENLKNFGDFRSLFNLSNLIKRGTYLTKNHKWTIDSFTPNKSHCFQNTHVI